MHRSHQGLLRRSCLLPIVAALALSVLPASAQSWTRTLEHTGADAGLRSIACCVRSVPSGGFAVAGHYLETPRASFLTVLADDGEIIWQRRYSAADNLFFRSLATTSDGGFLVGAFTPDGLAYLKMDSLGNVTWTVRFGDQGSVIANDANDVAETADGNFIVTGTTFIPARNADRAWIAKLSPTGAVVWQYQYHETFASSATTTEAMEPTSDGGAIIAGTVDCVATNMTCGILLKLRSNGFVDWAKTYDYSTGDRDRLMAVDVGADGGFLAVGRSVTFGQVSFVQRTDSSGGFEWAATMPLAPDWPYGVAETADGGAIVPNATGNNQWRPAVLFKFDGAGNYLWQRAFGACGSHPVYDMDLAPGGFVFAGEASFKEVQVQPTDAWVSRVASDGTIEGACPHEVDSTITPTPVVPTVKNENVQRSNVDLPIGTVSVTVSPDTAASFEACGACITNLYPEVSSPESSMALRFTDAVTLTWDAGPVGLWTGFNLYRAVDAPEAGHVCHMPNLPTNTVLLTEEPAPGELYSYLVTGLNADGESILGRGSVYSGPFRPIQRCPTERRAFTYCP